MSEPLSAIRYFYTICEATGCGKCAVNIKPMAASWKHARCKQSTQTPQMVHDLATRMHGRTMVEQQKESAVDPHTNAPGCRYSC